MGTNKVYVVLTTVDCEYKGSLMRFTFFLQAVEYENKTISNVSRGLDLKEVSLDHCNIQ